MLNLATPSVIQPINVTFDVFRKDNPTLLGIYVMDSEKITADTVLNRLVTRSVLNDNNNRPAFCLDY